MKKLFAIISLALCVSVSAQSTSPRFGTTKNNDNTGRVITYGWQAPTVTATTVITPNKSVNYYSMPTLTLSPVINFTVSASSAGDELTILTSASAATRTITLAGNVKSAGTYTLGSGKTGSLHFVFNGANYVEVSRFAEP